MPPFLLGAVPRSARFTSKAQQFRSRNRTIELPHVVEQHCWFRARFNRAVAAQITKNSVTNAALRDAAQLFLNGLQGLARVPVLECVVQIQTYRENRREPPNLSADVHIFK